MDRNFGLGWMGTVFDRRNWEKDHLREGIFGWVFGFGDIGLEGGLAFTPWSGRIVIGPFTRNGILELIQLYKMELDFAHQYKTLRACLCLSMT